jgi:hypothetical protein
LCFGLGRSGWSGFDGIFDGCCGHSVIACSSPGIWLQTKETVRSLLESDSQEERRIRISGIYAVSEGKRDE